MRIPFTRFEVIRTKAAPTPGSLSSPAGRGMSWPWIREPYTGAWQQNVSWSVPDVLTYAAVYACVTLIASDIAKLRIKLVAQDEDQVWTETENSAYSPVLRKPNRYQNRIKFLENWVTSKLIHGNTYVLKARDGRGNNGGGNVVAMYVLDPTRCRPLIAPDGSVFYALSADNLSGLAAAIVVPASEIMHDVMVPLYHPLCGVSPLTACGVAAVQGMKIQNNSAAFFGNGSNPGGILTAPTMTEEQAKGYKDQWEKDFSGDNQGRIAVLIGGLEYKPIPIINATDAQLIEQLKWTAENVCMAYHVPPYMIGAGPPPTYTNIEALNAQYYAQCLQNPIECIEALLDEGLGMPKDLGTELDLDDLLRMDTATRVKTAQEAMSAGMAPNEVRFRYHDLGKVEGGDQPLSQQQNFSLAALAKRDAQADPFATGKTAPQLPASEPATTKAIDEAHVTRRAMELMPV